jgi:UPF0176 protein
MNPYSVLLYYSYTSIIDTKQHIEWQRSLCYKLNLKGRIRVAFEGINGTLSGTTLQIQQYIHTVEALSMFPPIQWKLSEAGGHVFQKLEVMQRTTVVNLGAKVDLSLTGEYLTPKQFHNEIEMSLNDPNTIILDVRNNYEWNIGRFQGAVLPNVRQFSDFPSYFNAMIESGNLTKSNRVLAYCTGGVRCETATSYLRQLGIDNVALLEGGIHMYLQEFNDGGFFEGRNFVFDDRISTGADIQNKVVGKCHGCMIPYEDYTRKMSCPTCRILVLVCGECAGKSERIYCGSCVIKPKDP